MGRFESIARSIVAAILDAEAANPHTVLKRLFAALASFFAIYHLHLQKLGAASFKKLRNDYWEMPEEEYLDTFREGGKKHPEKALKPMADMGFSGSSFFSTADDRYLIKSVPRYFEHSFFRDDLMMPYVEYMADHPKTALIRICDFLAGPYFALGSIMGLAPTHHIVMENILYGQNKKTNDDAPNWETWDLKPTSYFYPERDIANGRLTSDATKDKLADRFEDKLVLTKDQADELIEILEEDTGLLAACNVVDYSLFLVRITAGSDENSDDLISRQPDIIPRDPPFAPPSPPSWRTGVQSPNGQHIFRAAILDFFWAKHKAQPMAMTHLIKAYNLIDRQGPMSITTEPHEYRERFLRMVKEMIEIPK